MKIAIIGATGMAGSKIFEEAEKRGHEVLAIVRNGKKAKELLGDHINLIEKDAFDLNKDELKGCDVILDAFATAPSKAYLHIDLCTKLIAMFRETEKPRLFFILGAGSLKTGEDNHLVVKDIEKDPNNDSFVQVPINQYKELKFLLDVDNVNWVGVSPGALFHAGPTTEAIQGLDNLLFNKYGKSETNSGTMAVAILDEIENPTHIKERFTVINK